MWTFPTFLCQVALYLCKELPLSLWQLRSEEICVIGAWLLQHPLSAVENRLACVILEGLNWGYTQVIPATLEKCHVHNSWAHFWISGLTCFVLQSGSLVLSSSLHAEVALLIAEAYQKYLTDKPYSGLLSEGIKQVTHPLLPWTNTLASSPRAGQFSMSSRLLSHFLFQVSYLASVLRLGVSPEASFSQWAWQLLLRLKLHGNAQNPKGAWSVPALTSNPPPELTHTPSMHSVIRAVKAGIPIGCYLSLAMTTVGHRFVIA